MKKSVSGKIAVFFIVTILWGFWGTAYADDIVIGSDYLKTVSAFLFFGAPINQLVEFHGLPIPGEPGNTDTIVQRQQESNGFPDTINIEVVNLSLENNAEPLAFVGGKIYYIKITLDTGTPSTGTMTINHEFSDNGTEAKEGTFISSFTVYFKVEFTPLDGGPAIGPIFDNKTFNNSGADWSHEPTAASITVPGVHPDQDANLHSGLPDFFNDFFVIGEAIHDAGDGYTFHTVKAASSSTLVELSSFEAIYERGRINVNWVTESELNTAGFDIERSQDPDSGYVTLNETMIPAKGDELTGAEYSFTDKNFKREEYYYRLKEYELDGDIFYYGPTYIDHRPKGKIKQQKTKKTTTGQEEITTDLSSPPPETAINAGKNMVVQDEARQVQSFITVHQETKTVKKSLKSPKTGTISPLPITETGEDKGRFGNKQKNISWHQTTAKQEASGPARIISWLEDTDVLYVSQRNLSDKDLFLKLLQGTVIVVNKTNPDYFRFSDTIENEQQLTERLKEIGVYDTKSILTIWRESHENK